MLKNMKSIFYPVLLLFSLLLGLAACSNSVQKGPIQSSNHSTQTLESSSKLAADPQSQLVSVPSATPASSAASASALPQESSTSTKSMILPNSTPTAAQSSAQPASPYSSGEELAPGKSSPTAPKKGVTISITGDDKLGVIMPSTLIQVEGEISAMALLQKATREHKLQMESTGTGIFAYVKGIANLYEFDRGAKSGWLFKVNGVVAAKGAGDDMVKAGDLVEWVYTLNLGKDIGAKK
jgi:hypothetical protein